MTDSRMQTSSNGILRASIITVVALLLGLAAPTPSHAGLGSDIIQQINQSVAGIDKAIQSGDLPYISISEESGTEGLPPAYKMYYSRNGDGKLIAAVVSVGHESWGNTFSYYFDDQQRVMKYLKTCEGRSDCPPKTAIIYGTNGKIVWKNTEEPAVPPSQIVTIYTAITQLRMPLSQY
jgi:hypothetical protein